MIVVGLIPICQLVQMTLFGQALERKGVHLMAVCIDPPLSPLILPAIAVASAICVAVWALVIVLRRSSGLIHTCIFLVFMLILASCLHWEGMRMASIGALVSRIQEEQHSQNPH